MAQPRNKEVMSEITSRPPIYTRYIHKDAVTLQMAPTMMMMTIVFTGHTCAKVLHTVGTIHHVTLPTTLPYLSLTLFPLIEQLVRFPCQLATRAEHGEARAFLLSPSALGRVYAAKGSSPCLQSHHNCCTIQETSTLGVQEHSL